MWTYSNIFAFITGDQEYDVMPAQEHWHQIQGGDGIREPTLWLKPNIQVTER